jgi:hypothetical protein
MCTRFGKNKRSTKTRDQQKQEINKTRYQRGYIDCTQKVGKPRPNRKKQGTKGDINRTSNLEQKKQDQESNKEGGTRFCPAYGL